jgi:hypothetical protein
MKLSKEPKGNTNCLSLAGKEDLRFELFDWLKSKNLNSRQAIDLLVMTRDEIIEARREEIDKISL